MSKPNFPKILKQSRKRLGLTQWQMAKRWDISQSNYSKFENGHLEPGGYAVWDLIEQITGADLSAVMYPQEVVKK